MYLWLTSEAFFHYGKTVPLNIHYLIYNEYNDWSVHITVTSVTLRQLVVTGACIVEWTNAITYCQGNREV